MDTKCGPRFRLQVTLPEQIVNVRIHACKDCEFIEWDGEGGEVVAETELSDEFVELLSSAVTKGQNRDLPELVPEGLKALKGYV